MVCRCKGGRARPIEDNVIAGRPRVKGYMLLTPSHPYHPDHSHYDHQGRNSSLKIPSPSQTYPFPTSSEAMI